jgi:ubiquinone/menaquinone biosynthesis C-methylase UbiE
MTRSISTEVHTDRWDRYLEEFHRERAGITEEVLGRSFGPEHHDDPYHWLLEPFSSAGPVLDLACGNAPLLGRRTWSGWVGLDASRTELGKVERADVHRLVCATADRLPFADHSFASIVCSMGLMVLQPMDEVLKEVRRVMAPGAIGCLLLPARRPLRLIDMSRYTRVLLALHQVRLDYPNDGAMSGLSEVLERFGFRVIMDQRRQFLYQFDSAHSVQKFVDSLYLPHAEPERIEVVKHLALRWVGSTIGIPLRRVLFERT